MSEEFLHDLFDMQGTALLGGVNALHTSFPDDAEEEYKTQGWACVLCFVYSALLAMCCG